jgi:hypothetical protein
MRSIGKTRPSPAMAGPLVQLQSRRLTSRGEGVAKSQGGTMNHRKRFFARSRSQRLVAQGLALVALALSAVGAFAAPVSEAAPKPGFPAGTWSGKGVISGTSSQYGQTTRTSGKATFTLKVARGGGVSGTGRWVTTEVGSGAISSTITGTATVRFGGTATLPTYTGTQIVKTSFSDGVLRDGNTFEAKKPFKGALRITRAGHCRVTGGHTVEGVSFKWTALLKGSGTCNT